MTTLIASPFSLTIGTSIKTKVTALNVDGEGPESDLSTGSGIIQTAPQKPTTPTRDSTHTSTTLLAVAWSAMVSPENGGVAVTSYHLRYDFGSVGGTYYDLIGLSSDSLLTAYNVSTNVVAGAEYRFQVRAKNIYDWGEWSDYLAIKAATLPGVPDTITTSEENQNFVIKWTLPTDNGETLDAYEILIRHKDGTTFSQETTNCNGQLSGVLTNRECQIPMNTLKASPFLLVFKDPVSIKIRAHNTFGWSDYTGLHTSTILI